MARRAGRQLPPWQEVETVQLNGLALRERALEWLGQKEKVTHPLVTSSERGHRAYLARCKEHQDCTKKWRFLVGQDDCMKVSELGDHTRDLDLNVPGLNLGLLHLVYIGQPGLKSITHSALIDCP